MGGDSIPFSFPESKPQVLLQARHICFFSNVWFSSNALSRFLERVPLHNLPISGPQTNWRSPDNVNGSEFVETPTVPQAKPSERATPKAASKMNGLREEHSHRGNGYISITGK